MSISRAAAMRFVLLLGLVSLLADMTHEGSRSITGPYLGLLGATGTIVGLVAGGGELIGYTVRIVSGYLSDRTAGYWSLAIVGYVVNLLAVPALALAGNWPLAATLIIVERFGKGLRTPARDAMLSHATKQMGHGWGFGIHKAMDQIGAVLGPLIVAVVLVLRGDYPTGFLVLLGPALLALAVLGLARFLYPRPRELEPVSVRIETKGFPKAYWTYLAGVALVAAGFADFALISFHFGQARAVPANIIPIFYAVAMGVDAVAALLFGRLFDRFGVAILLVAVLVSFGFGPLVFFGNFTYALLGTILWGIGLGAQESIMRAAVAGMVSSERRGTAFGAFNTGYGLSWFAGSAVMGVLYDVSLPALVLFSMVAQLLSIPFLVWTARLRKTRASPAAD